MEWFHQWKYLLMSLLSLKKNNKIKKKVLLPLKGFFWISRKLIEILMSVIFHEKYLDHSSSINMQCNGLDSAKYWRKLNDKNSPQVLDRVWDWYFLSIDGKNLQIKMTTSVWNYDYSSLCQRLCLFHITYQNLIW